MWHLEVPLQKRHGLDESASLAGARGALHEAYALLEHHRDSLKLTRVES